MKMSSPTAISANNSVLPFLTTLVIFCLGLQLFSFKVTDTILRLDYRSFYSAGYMLRKMPAELYDLESQKQVQNALVSKEDIPLPFSHPSYEAAIYAPFSFLPYLQSYRAFQIFNLLVLIAIFFVARETWSHVMPFWQPRSGLLFFPFFPLLVAAFQGQNSLLVFLLFCIGWKCLCSRREYLAGAVIALALFKFQFVLPIALLLSMRYGRRFAIGFTSVAASIALLCALITGRDGLKDYVHLIQRSSLLHDQTGHTQLLMAIHPLAMPNLNGLLYALGTRFLNPHMSFAIVGLLSLALILPAARAVMKTSDPGVAFSIAVIAGLLVSSHLYLHDATLLLLPIGLTGHHRLRLTSACYVVPAVLDAIGLFGLSALFSIPILAYLFSLLMCDPLVEMSQLSTELDTASKAVPN